VSRRSSRRRGVPFPLAGPTRWHSWLLRVAAVLLIAVGGALVWRATLAQRGDAPSGPPRIHEYATRPGQRAELRLADGTRVLLSVDSRIRVPADFGSSGRSLSLEGEAFFDVRHDPDRPFRVSTAQGVAEDLGTEFVVSAYPETRAMRVAVISGVVGLERATNQPPDAAETPSPIRLTRGDLALLDSARLDVRRDVNLAPYVGWTTGNLVFEGVPLRIALPRLERWYDVEIHLADPALGDRRLTATFRDAPLAHVLDLLALSFDLEVEQQGRSIRLEPKPATRAR
jgi:transmembrane sensor